MGRMNVLVYSGIIPSLSRLTKSSAVIKGSHRQQGQGQRLSQLDTASTPSADFYHPTMLSSQQRPTRFSKSHGKRLVRSSLYLVVQTSGTVECSMAREIKR